MNKNLVFLGIVRLCGALSLAVFSVSNCPYLLRKACEQSLLEGDLYQDSKVPLFKVRLPPSIGEMMQPSLSSTADEFRVFVMGDSFFGLPLGNDAFVRLLSARIKEPIYYETWRVPSPACIFKRMGGKLNRGKSRVLVLETAEHMLIERFSKVGGCPAGSPEPPPRSTAARVFDRLLTNDDTRYRYFLYNSFLTEPLVEAWKSLRFHFLGKLSEKDRKYSLNPPFLFPLQQTLPDSPTSFYYPHPDSLVNDIADNIQRMSDELSSRYNTKLIFMPIPSSYTINHGLINNDPYDRFIPRVCAELRRRRVAVVDVYDRFAGLPPGSLYYPTDDHWNSWGKAIALDALAETLK